MSEKNKLQEYCQKNKLPHPVYNSWSEGPDHERKWSSSVTIIIGDSNVKIDSTEPVNSKVAAEKMVARLMLDFLSGEIAEAPQEENEHQSEYTGDQREYVGDQQIKHIYLIDLENKPAFQIKTEPSALYIGFINSLHHSTKKYTTWHECKSDNIKVELSKNNKLLYLIEGAIRDLVDHFMTALVYPLVDFIQQDNIRPTITIVSGDYAGWCTRICLERVLKWRGLNGINIVNSGSVS